MNKKELFFELLISIILGVIATWIIQKLFCLSEVSALVVGIAISFMIFSGMLICKLIDHQKTMLEMIQQDLIETHGVIKPHESKLAITAQVVGFPAAQRIEITENAESIDLIRSFTYQDLILCPNYLIYFFDRVKQQNIQSRIIVIKEACQASLTYIILSYKAGYDTYVINDRYFIDFRKKHNIRKNKENFRIIMKGNPFVEKTGNIYHGKYSEFQSYNDVSTIKIINEDMREIVFNLLSCLMRNYCHKIDDDTLHSLSSINALAELLNTKKESNSCCNHRKD